MIDSLSVTDITYICNGHTQEDEHSLAAADVYAAHEASKSTGGGVAKTPTLRNSATGELWLHAS